MMFSNVADTQPLIKAGRIRSLAVTAAKRSTTLPEVPTMAEAGLKDFQMLVVVRLARARPARRRPIITRLNAETVKVLARADVKSALAAQGLEVISSTPEQFAKHIKSEIARMTKIAARRE